MTASTIENVLNTMRLAALSTTDYLTRDFLLQAIGENEEKAAVTLSETCWGEFLIRSMQTTAAIKSDRR